MKVDLFPISLPRYIPYRRWKNNEENWIQSVPQDRSNFPLILNLKNITKCELRDMDDSPTNSKQKEKFLHDSSASSITPILCSSDCSWFGFERVWFYAHFGSQERFGIGVENDFNLNTSTNLIKKISISQKFAASLVQNGLTFSF